MTIVFKSGSLNLLEPSGPVQDYNEIALPLPKYIDPKRILSPGSSPVSPTKSRRRNCLFSIMDEILCYILVFTSRSNDITVSVFSLIEIRVYMLQHLVYNKKYCSSFYCLLIALHENVTNILV